MPPRSDVEIQAELISKMIDLTSQLALTNQTLAHVGEAATKYEKVLYGEDMNGGLISRANRDHETINDPETGLIAQVAELTKNCNKVVGAIGEQTISIKNLNRVTYTIGIVVVIMVIGIGVADFKTLVTVLSVALGL